MPISDDEDSSSTAGDLDLFDEPEDWKPKEKPCTFQTYLLEEKDERGVVTQTREIKLRFVGSSPLWGHLLWNAARTLSTYLLTHLNRLVASRSVLELGAAAGLPSLICALSGEASTVVCTDYPDPELIENIKINVETVREMISPERRERCEIVAQGYLWGADVEPLLEQLQRGKNGGGAEKKFDLLILGDLLFNHSEHTKLLSTVRRTLARTADARALVFFTPYRPWLYEKDMAFFAQAKRVGANDQAVLTQSAEGISEQQQKEEARLAEDGYGPLKMEKVLEHVMEEVMFKEDRGDELLRRTVFGYELMWEDLQDAA